MSGTQQNLQLQEAVDCTSEALAKWRVYDHTVAFLESCLHFYYLEGITFRWRDWFPFSSETCPFVGLFQKLMVSRSVHSQKLLGGLDSTQRIKALRDLRIFVARNFRTNKKLLKTEFDELNPNIFGRGSSTTSGAGEGTDPKRVSESQVYPFEAVLPHLTSCNWKNEILRDDNSVDSFGSTFLASPQLNLFLKQQLHNHLLSTPGHLLLESERRLKATSLRLPLEIFKTNQEPKKLNFPNIGRKDRAKKEAIFIHNLTQSDAEIYFLVNKKFKKTNLMESIFSKLRLPKGFQLKFAEDVESISHVRGGNLFDFSGHSGRFNGPIERLRIYFENVFVGESQLTCSDSWMLQLDRLDWSFDIKLPRPQPLSKDAALLLWNCIQDSKVFAEQNASDAMGSSSKCGQFESNPSEDTESPQRGEVRASVAVELLSRFPAVVPIPVPHEKRLGVPSRHRRRVSALGDALRRLRPFSSVLWISLQI